MRANNNTGTLLTGLVYDANGGVTKKCEGGTVTRSPTDCSGTTVTSLSYDALNQLSQVAKTGVTTQTYGYDHQGRRVRKTSTIQQYFLYNGENLYAESRNALSGGMDTLTSFYAFAGTDSPIIRMNGFGADPATSANATYYHQDGLGSIVATSVNYDTTTLTSRFDAWGNRLNTTAFPSAQLYGYTGREPDQTGLVYYRARYYDPAIGRFTQRDPIGMRGGINQYAYVGNNPVNFNDPSGLLAKALFADATNAISYTGSALTNVGQSFTQNLKSFANYTSNNFEASVASARNDDFSDSVNKIFAGLPGIGGAEVALAGFAAGSIKSVVTGAKTLAAGQGGRFANLVGTVGDDLTAHHIPQAALKFTSRADGGAVVMTTVEHEATRTFSFKGAATAVEDSATSFRDVLAKDIRDVRSIVGNAYNEGLKAVTDYYRQHFPDLMKKDH